MPRKALGPRLYLRRDGEHKAWIIRHTGRDMRTGCLEHDLAGAQKKLAEYKQRAPLPMPDREVGDGFVYFVTCVGSANYPVKIGWSAQLTIRIDHLQNANPNLLQVLATVPGTRADERMLHEHFGHLHIRGEWFLREGDLLAYIQALPSYKGVFGAEVFTPAANSNRDAAA